MQDISTYIEPAAATYMRTAIAEAGGNEVFFIATCGPERRVISAEVMARGDDASVPALAQNAAVGDVVVHNHPSGALTPSKPDLQIAATLGSRGVGFFIINNMADDVYAVVEPFAKEALLPIEAGEAEAALGEGGALSKAMKGYEPRAGQVLMADALVRAFNEGKVAALEGGTGIGKSMAYLVPSLLWVLKNHERVVISTNTINLQQQLIEKDIPLLGRAFPEPFKAVLVKGRGNYLCLRKLDLVHAEPDFLIDESEKAGIAAIADWAANTKEGSRSDLGFMPMDELWEKVGCESDSCSKLKCSHFAHCFFFRARREAASADILVVNHHILLADIALRSENGGSSETAILPGYSRLIIDEGHNLEDGATSYFGSRISRLGMLKTLGRLHHRRDRDGGALPFLVSRLKSLRGGREKKDAWIAHITGKMVFEKESAVGRVNDAFDALYIFLQTHQKAGAPDLKVRIMDKTRKQAGWDEVVGAFDRLAMDLSRLVRSAGLIATELADEGLDDKLSDPLLDLKSVADRLEAAATTADMLINGKDDGLVRWVEAPARKAGKVVTVCGSPLNVALEIKTRIYDRLKTVLVTSATLTVKKKFDYIKKRIGLDLLPESRLLTGVYPSPFDYSTQVVIGIPRDIPDPVSREFGAELVNLVRSGVKLSRGRAFVLFTSFKLLNDTYTALEAELSRAGIRCMKQGDIPRNRLLDDFKKYSSAVLFGTDSFWEGVDVVGDALSNVIITKLPFAVPDDPVIEARQEEILAAGGNPFMEYTVPQAVIKFRQGFGRLIRSQTDRGCILIFDRRVVEKNYGRDFIDSLPDGQLIKGTKEEVFGKVGEFFAIG